MSKDQISRLEGLLERVQSRASMPRSGHGNGAAAAAYGDGAAIEPAPETPPMQAHSRHETEPPVTNDYDESDVEVSSEVVEVDIDIDEPTAMESGAQPIASPTMPPDELEEVIEEAPLTTQPSHHPSADAEELTQANMTAAPANEIEEPTPSSSRRPIAGEEPAPSYEEESSPRHTPPPESGKQVAAPSVHPKPSAPPPSLEGHTLIGGWREPGLGAPQVGVTTGVRVPAPPAEVAPAQVSGTRLTADVTKPEPIAAANVASFQGSPPVAKPSTLGELLDLTLGL